MKKTAAISNIFLLFTSVLIISGFNACKSIDSRRADHFSTKKESWLFAQMADSGTIEYNKSDNSYTVILNGAAPVMVKFTDTPIRKASTIKTKDFADNWNKMFLKNKPNAAIVALIKTPSGYIEEVAVCTIFDVSYDKKREIMAFKVKKIPAASFIVDKKGKAIDKIPGKFGPMILFIDSAYTSKSFSVIIKNQTGNSGLYIQTDKSAISKGTDLKNNPLPLTQLECIATNTYRINVPIPTSSLRVYLFNNKPPKQSEFAPNDPGMAHIRYDYFEVTVDGTVNSCADLSSLDQLGMCIALQSSKGGKLVDTMGWKTPLEDIITKFGCINNRTIIYSGSTFIRVIGPTLGGNIWTNFPDWNKAFQDLEG